MTAPGPVQVVRQPGSVFAASYLFAGVAAFALVTAVASFFAVPELSHHYSERAGDGAAGTATSFGLLVFGFLAIVFGAVCLLLAILGGRGAQAARVLIWVLSGLIAAVNVVLLIAGVYDPVPWYANTVKGLAGGTLLLTGIAVVLFALPASHGYYRAVRALRAFRAASMRRLPPPPRMMPPPMTRPMYPPPPARPPVPPPGYRYPPPPGPPRPMPPPPSSMPPPPSPAGPVAPGPGQPGP